MVRTIGIFLVLGLILGLSGWIIAQDGGAGALKRPLDLPSGGLGSEDEEEDSPEIISFYGSDYEGDAFFWCFDRSGSMSWGGVINTLKSEMTTAINQLSTNADFSVVRFNTSFQPWSTIPKRATPTNKGSALGWVSSTTATGGTCIAPATVQTLNICFMSTKQAKRVILVGDGVPECTGPPGPEQNQQTLSEINAANYQNVPIDTVFISNSEAGVQLFQDIAASNGGQFTNPAP